MSGETMLSVVSVIAVLVTIGSGLLGFVFALSLHLGGQSATRRIVISRIARRESIPNSRS